MAETFILKKRQDFLFALEDHEDKVYHLPALKSLGFEEAKKYREANGQILRRNQWQDLTCQVYI